MTKPPATQPEAMSPDDLLAGPRGRRLCLLYATQNSATGTATAATAEELRVAAIYATMGSTSTILSASRFFGDVPASGIIEIPHVSPAEVAHLLRAVPLAPPSARTMIRDLADAVAHARYWQEPDGEDVLLALPEVRATLPRIAELIVTSPENFWWMTRADAHNQWIVTFPPSARDDRLDPLPALQRLERWRASAIEEESRAQRDRPADPTENYSGTWWSAPIFTPTATTRALPDLGPVGVWAVEDRFDDGAGVAVRVDVPTHARIYEITDAAAWAELCRRYPLEVTASRRHDWYRTTGRSGRWIFPDWLLVAEDYDGVHLTVAAYLSAAGRAIPVDDVRASVIAGWNPDTTHWLRDVVGAASDTEAWEYDQDDELWVRRSPADPAGPA